MSFLSSVTSILELIKIPGTTVPREDYKPTRPDDCGDGEQLLSLRSQSHDTSLHDLPEQHRDRDGLQGTERRTARLHHPTFLQRAQ